MIKISTNLRRNHKSKLFLLTLSRDTNVHSLNAQTILILIFVSLSLSRGTFALEFPQKIVSVSLLSYISHLMYLILSLSLSSSSLFFLSLFFFLSRINTYRLSLSLSSSRFNMHDKSVAYSAVRTEL